jgi:DNA repair protein RecO (recombination protein O)
MMEKVEGIVLNSTNYKESSKILNILTKKYGLIGVVSKGCKRPKSLNKIGSSNFTFASFSIYYKKDKLSILVSCDIIDYFKNIRSNIELISYLNYLCNLAYNVVKQNDDSKIYSILISALKKINEGFDPLVITNILEIKYLDFLGVSINLDECVVCGSSSIINLSPYQGGYVCKNCNTNTFIYDTKTLKMLRLYYYVDIDKINELKISKKITTEINSFISEYYSHFTGLYLKSKKFMENLMNM